jgi:hypothetical protein
VSQPGISRPKFAPSYGLAAGGLLPWSHAIERLGAARNYWLATTRPDGRPHAAPVWGVWFESSLYFGTSRDSRKARNLVEKPAVVVHLEERRRRRDRRGTAGEVGGGALLEPVVEAYERKYDFRPELESDSSVWYAVRPPVAYAWLERDFTRTATRYAF